MAHLTGGEPGDEFAAPKPALPRIADYEQRARRTMQPALYDRLFGGEGGSTWLTNQNNMNGFRRVKLRPKVLIDVRERSLATTVLGDRISLPVMLAPVGTHKRAHPRGELASVRAAGRAGTIMAVSTSSSYNLEEIAAEAVGPIWFQLYCLPDQEFTASLVKRAEQAGYTALVVTVDSVNAPVDRRRSDTVVWNIAEAEAPQAHGNFPDIELPGSTLLRAAWHESGASWADMAWLVGMARVPVVIKGIQTAEDAIRAANIGVAGIIVSNHGGNALEDAVSTVEQLVEIVDAVGDRVEVYLDGGVRKGIDVLKALAMGAKAVFVGRPIYWGLAADGESGVVDIIDVFRSELDMAMALCGVADVTRIERELVKVPNDW